MANVVAHPHETPPPRPALALRVGVTGARDLDATMLPHLVTQLHTVLALVRRELAAMPQQPWFAGAYAAEAATPSLRLLSPLARGADRLTARAALAEGYGLHVPMPFPQPLYELDFPDPADLAEFRDLRRQAGGSCLELDGDPIANRDAAYEAAGRYVVRNCDLLLAVWDGNTDGNGRGGTADIVRYAAATGVPTWWLHARQPAVPAFLADMQDIRDPPMAGPPPEQALRAWLRALVQPPAPAHRHQHGVLDRVARLGRGHVATPMAEYFGRGHAVSLMPLGRLHLRLMRLMGGPAGALPRPPGRGGGAALADPVAAFWYARFRPADWLAVRYADQYRAGYVWTFLFATLSVVLGACSLLVPDPAWREAWLALCGGGELAMLVLVLILVGVGIRQDWHEHSIEFRLLAELCRKQQALGPLGWTLPIVDVRGLADQGDAAPERGAWVGWLFAADQRAAPLPTGALASTAQGPVRRAILDDLIAEQRFYHAARAMRDGRAARRLAAVGETLFLLVLTLVTVKLVLALVPAAVLPWQSWGGLPLAELVGLLVTVLPAMSAAFVGVRAYSEVPVMAVQSRHMEAVLKAAHDRVERLRPERPLVSQDLGAEAAAVATLMLQDLDGWARLFRVKSLEAG